MDIKTQIKDKENVFFDMEAYLPKKNGSVLTQVIKSLSTLQFIFHMFFFVYVCFYFCVCFQAVPEFGFGKCERNASQQPGKVCGLFSLEDSVKRPV